MARRPRITLKGYYHIINRGVEQRKVFLKDEDFKKFETLLKYKIQGSGDNNNIKLSKYMLNCLLLKPITKNLKWQEDQELL